MLRRVTRQDIQGNLSLFKTLLTATHDMIFRLSDDGIIRDFYSAIDIDPNLHADDLIGKHLDNIFPPDLSKKIKLNTQRTLQTGILQICETPLNLNGQQTHIEARYIPCGEDEVIIIVCDITPKKRMETALQESEARFRNAFDYAAIGRAIASPQGRFIRVNNSFCQLIGYTSEELLTRTWMEITQPEDKKTGFEYSKDLLNGVIPSYRHVHRLIHKNGHHIWVDLTVVVLRDQNGIPLYVVGDIVDITERVLAERALIESEEIYREFVEGTDDLITQVDQQGIITFVNHRSRKIFGLSPEECIGLSTFEFVHPDDREASQQAFTSWVDDKIKNTTYENRQISHTGQVFHMLWTINFHYDPQGELTCINSIGRDISKRKVTEHLLEYLATHDTLTGLPNRSLFSDRLRHALLLAKRSSTYIAVMFIDLDDFKSVNDIFGHEMGDQVLKRVAKILQNCVRESDTVARLSGDEFTLAVENIIKPEDPAAIAHKILSELSEPIREDEQQITITASIGISIYPTDGEDENSLLKKADAAMYQVKKTRKNNFLFSS